MTGRIVPAAPAQQRLWLYGKLHPESASYVIASPMELRGTLEVPALRMAAADLMMRHEVLRSTFLDQRGEGLGMRIADQAAPVLDVLDLAARADPGAAAEDAARSFGEQPMDLARGPLFRMLLCRLGRERYALTMLIHHIIADAWTVALLWKELGQLYSARTGHPVTLPSLGLPYSEHARERLAAAAGGDAREELTNWLRRLDGVSIDNSLRTDQPRSAVSAGVGRTLALDIPSELAGRVRAAGRRSGCTPFMTLLTGFAATLAHYDRRDEVVVATQLAGRTDPRVAGTAGFFVNTLPIRFTLDEDTTLAAALDQARAGTLAAFATEHVTYEQLVHALAPLGDRSMNPLAQVAFQLLSVPIPDVAFGSLGTRRWWDMTRDAKFDISVIVVPERDGSLRGLVTFAAGLYREITIRLIWQAYLQALEALTGPTGTALWGLELTTLAQRRLLDAVARGGRSEPVAGSVPDRIAAHASDHPDRVAVCTPDGEMTYRQLWEGAGAVARVLRTAGVRAEDVVAVDGDARAAAIVSILGAWRAGVSVVVCTSGVGTARFDQVADATGVRVGLATSESIDSTSLPARVRWLRSPAAGEAGDTAAVTDGPVDAGPGAPRIAYFLSTSGSTGQPRMVATSMAAFCLFLDHEAARTAGRTVIQIPPLNYDPGMRDVFLTLVAGARLYVDDAVASNPVGSVHRSLRDRCGDAILAIVPSILDAVLTAIEQEHGSPHAGPVATLAVLRCCGEALPRRLAARAARLLGCVPENNYGPSECTMVTCASAADPAGGDSALMPIGRPVAGARAWLQGRRGQLLPPAFTGEIVIGGDHVSAGYLDDHEATALAFTKDPRTGERVFRTGDLGYLTAGGDLQWIGRIDRQVKVRGVRVDVVEVEETLRRHRSVTDAAVILAEDAGSRVLAAFVTLEHEVQAAELRDYLRLRVPRASVPSVFQRLEAIPRTERGKLVRSLLPAVHGSRSDTPSRPAAEGLERDVAVAFAEVLAEHDGQLADIGADDDFFELGGHSLAAVTVACRLSRRLGCRVVVTDVFDHPTVHELAEYVRRTRAASAETRPANAKAEIE